MLQVETLDVWFGSGRDRVDAVKGATFGVAEGESFGLVGESGSGKSTLLNVVSGILRPDSGQVLIGGLNIVKLAEPQRDRLRADRIGLVFQQFNLLPGFTALENVLVAMSFGSQASNGAPNIIAYASIVPIVSRRQTASFSNR